jgi:hypothetical protein
MDNNVDSVLAELKTVGALGVPQQSPRAPVEAITEVQIEQGPPSPVLRDLRGPKTVAAVDEAVAALDVAVRGLEGARAALMRLREVWEPAEDAEPLQVALETPLTAAEAPATPVEAPEGAATPSEPPEGTQSPPDDEQYARARENALRKIRGEDVPEAGADDEDNVPFVGQVRATLPGQEPEEVTIGTVGTIKPNFPTEEQDGT